MPLFVIRRNVTGLSRDDIDAAAFRAIACAFDYDGLYWRRSFWDSEREELLCVYQAQDAAQLEDHARRARIPCDEVREVTELVPDEYVATTGGQPPAVE